MATKAEALAAKFEQTSKEFAAKIEKLSDKDWQATCPEEGWTVAATAHHAAGASAPLSLMAQSAATGSPMPAITPAGLDQMNADHAKQFATVSRADTLAVLRESTGPAAAIVRSLSDEQLGRGAMLPFGMEMTAEQVIENVLIGHMAHHGASIDAAR